MPGQQVVDEVTNDRIWFVTQFRDYAADKCAAASVPLQIDCAMRIVRAVDLGPAMRPARLLGPDFDEAEFSLQLRVAHDFIAQRSTPGRNNLDYRLHPSLGSAVSCCLQRTCAKVDRGRRANESGERRPRMLSGLSAACRLQFKAPRNGFAKSECLGKLPRHTG